MKDSYRTRLETFTENDLPDLDEVVLGALEYLESASYPDFVTTAYARPLIVGSGNALQAGRLLFKDVVGASFAEEGEAVDLLSRTTFDALYIVSASGAKHAIMLAEKGLASKLPTYLITANPSAPVKALVGADHTYVFPHIREPYTYNTSTYLSMLLSRDMESPSAIREHIEKEVAPSIPSDLGKFTAYILVIPGDYGPIRKMFETKFDELFGPHIAGRAFTVEELKHAKTVITAPTQCFISLGTPLVSGTEAEAIQIPLPAEYGPAALISIGYYVIGKIQKVNPPYFKEHIAAYTKETSATFGHHIGVIVE